MTRSFVRPLPSAATILSLALATSTLLGCGSPETGDDGDGTSTTSMSSTQSQASSGGATGSGGGGGSSSSSTGTPMLETIVALEEDGTTPRPGADVIVSSPTGEIVDSAVTDAEGKATLDVPEGGSLTVGSETTVPNGASSTLDHRLVTVVDVPDGGAVTLPYFPSAVADPAPNDTMVMVAQVHGLPATTDHWRMTPSCTLPVNVTTANQLVIIDDYRGCPGQSTFNLVVTAFDQYGSAVGLGIAKDLPFEPGPTQTTLFHVYVSAADLTGSFSGNIFNIPPGSTSAYIRAIGFLEKGGSSVFLQNTSGSLADHMSFTTLVASTAAEPVWNFDANVDLASGGHVERTRRELPDFVSPFDLDVAAITHVVHPSADLSDPSRPKVSWGVDAGGSADASYVRYAWNEADSSVAFTWHVLANPGAGSVAMPVLPDAEASWPTPPVALSPGVFAQELDDLATPDFAAWLADPERGDDVIFSEEHDQ